MPLPPPSPDFRAVVTGASNGIGEALAIDLAARGHNLIITARREALLDALAARLTDQYGVTVEVRPGDLGDAAQRAKLAEELGVESSLIVVRGVDTDVSPFDAGLFKLKENRYRPELTRFVHEGCRGSKNDQKARDADAVPARFLMACPGYE